LIGSFLLGLLAFILFLLALRAFARADPKKLAGRLRMAGGIAALGIAAVLMARGLIIVAIPLAAFGLGLLGTRIGGMSGAPFPGQKSSGQKSRVRTAAIEMELDHDTGAMDGICLGGRFDGQLLSSLSRADLLAFLQDIAQSDPQSAALLEAYLDQREPGWRGSGADQDSGRQPRQSPGRMGVDEAFEVLGLAAGATAEEIRDAHRRLMKRMHPDQGGSTYLAARINEAKDVLLGRRRA
jgi:hypothetical protein